MWPWHPFYPTDSGIRLASDALRGEDMDESLHNELQSVKRKAADGLESVVRKKKKQNVYRDNSNTTYIKRKKTKYNQPKRRIIKKKSRTRGYKTPLLVKGIVVTK